MEPSHVAGIKTLNWLDADLLLLMQAEVRCARRRSSKLLPRPSVVAWAETYGHETVLVLLHMAHPKPQRLWKSSSLTTWSVEVIG